MVRKNKPLIITVIAAVMIFSASAGFSIAYFSDYTQATGDAAMHLSGQTELTEYFADNSKTISVTNTSKEPVDMVVRIKIAGPSTFTYTYDQKIPHHWVEGSDGWWYYDRVVPQGKSSSDLKVTWEIPKDNKNENYDIAVLHDSFVVKIDKEGNIENPKGWEGPVNDD